MFLEQESANNSPLSASDKETEPEAKRNPFGIPEGEDEGLIEDYLRDAEFNYGMNTEKYLRLIARAIFIKKEIRAIERASKPMMKPGMGFPGPMLGGPMMGAGMAGMGLGMPMGARMPGAFMPQMAVGPRGDDFRSWNALYAMARPGAQQMYGYPKFPQKWRSVY